MPLAHPNKVGENIRLLMAEGKPYRQAVAIALHTKDRWEQGKPKPPKGLKVKH